MKLRQTVFPLLAAMIWGLAFVAQKMNTLGAFTFIALRSALAFLFLIFLILVTHREGVKMLLKEKTAKGSRALWIGGLLTGVLLAAASYFQQHGMDLGTDAGKAGFITALYIVLVPLCGLAVGKRGAWNIWLAVAIAAAALYFICVTKSFTIQGSDIWILMAPVLFCAQIMTIDRFSPLCDPMKFSCVQFLGSFLFSALLAFLTRERLTAAAVGDCLLPVLYLGIFSSGIGYTLQIAAQRGGNPAVVSVLLSMESVFSLLFGALILGETMSARQYIGCGLMLAAVLLTQIPTGKSAESGTERPERER